MSDFLMQSPETDGAVHRPCVVVAVVMRRERIANRWQPWRWVLADVVNASSGPLPSADFLYKPADPAR